MILRANDRFKPVDIEGPSQKQRFRVKGIIFKRIGMALSINPTIIAAHAGAG
jgi:hypothetical protein